MIETLLPSASLAFIFGGVPEGIGLIFYIWGSIWATKRVIGNLEGTPVPVWLALIWLIPCFGAIMALIAVKRKTPSSYESVEE